MELFYDEIMAELLDDSLATAALAVATLKWSNPQHGGGCSAGRFIKWHTIKNQEDSALQAVQRIRSHPLTPKIIPIYG